MSMVLTLYHKQLLSLAERLKHHLHRPPTVTTQREPTPLQHLKHAAHHSYITIRSRVISAMLKVQTVGNNKSNTSNIIYTAGGFLYPIPGNTTTDTLQQILDETITTVSTKHGYDMQLTIKTPPATHDPTHDVPTSSRTLFSARDINPTAAMQLHLSNQDVQPPSPAQINPSITLTDSGTTVTLLETAPTDQNPAPRNHEDALIHEYIQQSTDPARQKDPHTPLVRFFCSSNVCSYLCRRLSTFF